MTPHTSNRISRTLATPHFWLVVAMLAAGVILHYPQQILGTDSTSLFSFLGMSRHAMERIFLLLPITYAGFFLGVRWGLASLAIALAIMLPRVFLISLYPADALFETSAIMVIGGLVNLWFRGYRKEQRRYQKLLSELESAKQGLQMSEKNYRELFEGANDAIWVHDLEGNILIANKACERLTGYSIEELGKKNVKAFLSEESLNLAKQVREKLFQHEHVDFPYEQRLFKKDRTDAICMLTTSLIVIDGKPKAFQNIARDVTNEKRMQESLRFYLQQVTRAQEEERKRIARELHDDTAQELVALSRRLDRFISSAKSLSEQDISFLEEVRKKADSILDGVRRFSQDLRPSILDDLGLVPALEWLTSDLSRHFGIAVGMGLVGSVHRFPPETELVLFRVAQEALRNVCKHSGASRAWVTMEFGKDWVTMTIKDNGKGFELPERVGDLAKSGKLGLAGMQERIQLIGGKLTLHSNPGEGTAVTVEVPI